ncbi:hypothetical protein Q5424_21245 [Conexibacter sp. JD483]|uniref:hypothetical protein n=1 Tax=unclassified Conexibacter TaxID=2627773 RepID=UPI00271946E5|nr:MULTISPECIES: hypothetical protein [unclassified Conexibacter]MDO8185395.1 hypothetical protein [Conexibacter sp. CPCC 205706]MDO8198429.1 hypothetical protein [Conexibacter sp. CPCC 205762]MDR9371637.1 hypothetical protein [Conexibacter sp. JD483]
MLVALLALSACGGGSTPAPTTAQQARSPCPRAIAAALGAAADARLDDRSDTVVDCTYRAGATTARVRVDSAPQAQFRFSRAVVESGQAHLGDPPSELPQVLDGIGAGAAWTAAGRELLATDGRRLVTVTVVRPRADAPARATAVTVARAALKP